MAFFVVGGGAHVEHQRRAVVDQAHGFQRRQALLTRDRAGHFIHNQQQRDHAERGQQYRMLHEELCNLIHEIWG